LAVITFFVLIIAAPISAKGLQSGRMMTGQYDPKTEITFTGAVEKIHRLPNANMPTGMHLIVKSRNQSTEIRLGPAAFVEKTMEFKEGDSIQIIGSKITMMGRTVVIAREVRKDDQVLTLRDEKGVPVWSRTGRPIS
jgi:hypothetical protein